MTTDDTTDVPDPLAGVDLHAWQPPAPPAGQVAAILGRLDATRTDVVAAIEVEPRGRAPRRARWLAIGVVAGVAAAALTAFAAWPRDEAPKPAGDSVASLVARLQQLEAERTALVHDLDQLRAERDQAGATIATLQKAITDKTALLDAATAAAAAIKPGATVKRPKQWDFSGKPPTQLTAPAGCDANALLDEARAAGSANQWSVMLQKAEASNRCSPAKIARQLSLLAACHLGDRDKAMKYWSEFQTNAGMHEACIGLGVEP